MATNVTVTVGGLALTVTVPLTVVLAVLASTVYVKTTRMATNVSAYMDTLDIIVKSQLMHAIANLVIMEAHVIATLEVITVPVLRAIPVITVNMWLTLVKANLV